MIPTRNPNFFLRFATPDDAGLVVRFMQKLGTYQQMADKIIATEAGIRKLLTEGKGESVFGVYKGEIVAFFYFCQTSSAFMGQSGIYMDGFYVDDAYRSHGLGKIMMAFLAKLAVERGCQRLEWGCLDWNEPSISFYKKLGAYGVENMTIYRFSPDTLRENALRF